MKVSPHFPGTGTAALAGARIALLLALVAAITLVAGAQRSARAAEATFASATVENGYPTEVVFRLTASSDIAIERARLLYSIVGRGASAVGIPEPEAFTPGLSIETEVRVKTDPNTNWIPVGNDFDWQWELTHADGTVSLSEPQRYLYMPPGDWQSVENAVARVYYIGARDDLAGRILEALEGTYREHGQGLLETELEKVPVRVIVMRTNAELQEASPSKGSTLDNSTSVVTCGFRPGNADDIIFGAVSCGGSDPVDTMRHEFAHILNAAAGEGTLVKLPFWLDEGLAVYAQDDPSTYVATFNAALRRNALLPFRQMNTSSADQSQIILQYGQGFMMTTYLIDTYGQAKLNELLAATKANTRFDVAFEQVYGVDQDGFEEAFLAAVGSAQQPTATPTARPTQQPTARPTQAAPTPTRTQAAPAAPATGGSDDGGISRTTIAIIGAAMLLLLCAVMAFLVAMFLQNQRTGAR